MDIEGMDGRGGSRGRGVSAEEGRLWRRLRALVVRFRVPAADAEDVTQAVMMAVREAEASFVVPEGRGAEGAQRAFHVGIVKRQVARHRRELSGWGRVVLLDELEGGLPEEREGAPSAEERVMAAEDHALCLELLAAVPEERRVVWIEYQVEGRAMVDIAAELAISTNTAWNRLRLARLDLDEARRRWRARERGREASRMRGVLR